MCRPIRYYRSPEEVVFDHLEDATAYRIVGHGYSVGDGKREVEVLS